MDGSTRDVVCHRCGDEAYFVAKMPHPGLAAHPDPGFAEYRRVVVCPRCDANDPAAQGLLAYFAYHGRDIDPTDEAFTTLAEQWAAIVLARPTGVDAAALDEDIAEWERDQHSGA